MSDLHAQYDAACRRFYETCKAIEAAEDERDAARHECERLERIMESEP